MLCYALDKHHQSSAARRSMIKVKPVSCNLLAKGTEVAFSYFFPHFEITQKVTELAIA